MSASGHEIYFTGPNGFQKRIAKAPVVIRIGTGTWPQGYGSAANAELHAMQERG